MDNENSIPTNALPKEEFERIFATAVRALASVSDNSSEDEASRVVRNLRTLFPHIRNLHDASNPIDYAYNIFGFGRWDGSWKETVAKYSDGNNNNQEILTSIGALYPHKAENIELS